VNKVQVFMFSEQCTTGYEATALGNCFMMFQDSVLVSHCRVQTSKNEWKKLYFDTL